MPGVTPSEDETNNYNSDGSVCSEEIDFTTSFGYECSMNYDYLADLFGDAMTTVTDPGGQSDTGNTVVNIYGSNLADATTAVFFGVRRPPLSRSSAAGPSPPPPTCSTTARRAPISPARAA